MTSVGEWLAALRPDQQEQVGRLVDAVRAAEPAVAQAVKWGRLTFTVGDDWHHWLCAVAVARSGVALTFHKGALLADPDGLLDGSGRYVRQVRHDQAVAHPDAVAALVRDAVAHQTDLS